MAAIAMGMDHRELPTRVRALRRKLVFLWFALGPATITIYIGLCKLVEPKLLRRGAIAASAVDSVDWVLVGACVVGTAFVLFGGRRLMSEEGLRSAAAREPTAEMPDPLAARLLAMQVLMGTMADFIVLVGMLMFYLGAPFDKFLNFAIYGLGLTIYIGGTIPARLNRFEEVAVSIQEGVSETGESSKDV